MIGIGKIEKKEARSFAARLLSVDYLVYCLINVIDPRTVCSVLPLNL